MVQHGVTRRTNTPADTPSPERHDELCASDCSTLPTPKTTKMAEEEKEEKSPLPVGVRPQALGRVGVSSFTWRPWEVLLYSMVSIGIMTFIVLRLYGVSRRLEEAGLWGLKDGWILGHSRDDSDIQWRLIRSNLPFLVLFASLHVAIRRVLLWRGMAAEKSAVFHAVVGLAVVVYLHGAGAVFVIFFVVANYLFSHIAAGKSSLLPALCGPVLAWTAVLFVLCLGQKWDRVRVGSVVPPLAFLDAHMGSYRWYEAFNLLGLRLLSFTVDRYWQQTPRPPRLSGKEDVGSYRYRQETLPPPERFVFSLYIGYVLYPPLYLAGPTGTYSAWVSQIYSPPHHWRKKDLAAYVVRWGANVLVMEVFCHFIYVNAAMQSVNRQTLWNLLTPSELGYCAFFALFHIWLKFTVLWRLFRGWALWDNIEVPENMNRCVFNNYSMVDFWRNWHRSFNQWLLRYLYVPLGGREHQLRNTAIVFAFVALWHEVEPHLFAWAAMVSVVVVLEIFAQRRVVGECIQKSCLLPWKTICGAAAAANILGLMAANLVGFAFGLDGLGVMLRHFGTLRGAVFLLESIIFFFCLSNLMFILRAKSEEVDQETQTAVPKAYRQLADMFTLGGKPPLHLKGGSPARSDVSV